MGLIIVAAWLIFIVVYNNWLIAKHGISAMRLSRIAVAAMDLFLWVVILGADGFSLGLLALIVLAMFILLTILGLNYKDCQNALHAILMTLFQITGGFLVFGLVCSITGSNRRKK